MQIHQLKITLKDSRPPIWRRFQVGSDVTLAKLHWVIQAVMGWHNSHLHQFIVGNAYYGEPSTDEFSEFKIKDERKTRLDQILLKPKQRMIYEYDFGDGWEHVIALEKILPAHSGTRYPQCIAGARACPPEDCGGIYGYVDFLEAIADPDHEQHDEMLDWIGGEFDPEAVDLQDINRSLKGIR